MHVFMETAQAPTYGLPLSLHILRIINAKKQQQMDFPFPKKCLIHDPGEFHLKQNFLKTFLKNIIFLDWTRNG